MNSERQRALSAEETVSDLFQWPSSEPASLAVDRQGVIGECSMSAAVLFGFDPEELLGCPISLLFPQLVDIEWLEKGQPNHRLSYLAHIGHCFAALARDGRKFASKLFLNDFSNGGFTGVRLLVRPVENLVGCNGGQIALSRGRIERNGVLRRRVTFHPLAAQGR